MKSKQKSESKSIGLGIIFILSVFIIVIISVFLKTLDLVRNSRYDGKSNYYVLLRTQNSWQEIILSPSSDSIKLLNVETKDNDISSIGLPYDLFSKNSDEVSKDNVKSHLISILSSTHSNPVDIVKILLFTESAPKESITVKDIDGNSEADIKSIPSFISDHTISLENITIEVSNATGVLGVGSVFAKMITNVGGDVVLVSTDEKISESSRIISKKGDALTLKKLSNLFGLKIDNSTAKISDVKIIIGKDLLKKINL